MTAKPISKERSLLSVASTTPNAAILLRLDGQARSPLPYQEEVFMGRHHVEIGGDGIKQASRWINVSQDARTDELLVESLTGKIQFETTPDDAIIQIRGKQANRGSSCHVLPEGRYLVEVHREGYKPYQLYFNVVADQNRIIRITLKK